MKLFLMPLAGTSEPTDAANKEGLLTWDLLRQSDFSHFQQKTGHGGWGSDLEGTLAGAKE